jgi:ABC-2 type transport system permease protein
MRRIAALLVKELAELRTNPGIFVPAILTAAIAMALPFAIAVILPAVSGEALADSSDMQIALELYRSQPAARALDPEAAIQSVLFQQFLILLVLSPVAASMSIAAYSVIGEKQARTLEPLLATPVSTTELLAAKVLGAFLPSLALSLACFGVYLVGIGAFARAGVALSLLAPRPLGVVLLIGPLASLAALQLAVCVSSRVNDTRSAQQLAALVVLPLTGLLIGQLTGAITLTMPFILVIAGVLCVANVGLLRLAVRLFDRESILTRWK